MIIIVMVAVQLRLKNLCTNKLVQRSHFHPYPTGTVLQLECYFLAELLCMHIKCTSLPGVQDD